MKSAVYLILLLTTALANSCFKQVGSMKATDCVFKFYTKTSYYVQDTAMLNNLILYEKNKYVNKRNKINWGQFKIEVHRYYLENMIQAYTQPMIDLLGKDSLCVLANGTQLYTSNDLHKVLNGSRNIYREIDSIYFGNLLINREQKMNTMLRDE